MKVITVRLSDEEFEKLRVEAFHAREAVSKSAARLLGMVLGRSFDDAVKGSLKGVLSKKGIEELKKRGEPIHVSDEDAPKRGVEVSLSIPANTEAEVKERVEAMVAKKTTTETDAAYLKRMAKAGRDLAARGD